MAMQLHVELVDRQSGEAKRATLVFRDPATSQVIYRYAFTKDGGRPKVAYATQYDDRGSFVSTHPNLSPNLFAIMVRRASAILFKRK